jgi:phosphoglycolate phosphatase
VDDFLALFRERARDVMVRNTHLLPGVASVVDRLRGIGLHLAIVSTKRRIHIEPVLRRHDLHSAFDVIVGGEDVESHKPDPEGLVSALERMSVSAAEAWYIGDTVIDAQTAERAGVPFTAVASGPTPRAAFVQLGVPRVLDDLGQLLAVLPTDDVRAP